MKKFLTVLALLASSALTAWIATNVVNESKREYFLELCGEENLTLEAGTDYVEAGAEAYSLGWVYRDRKDCSYTRSGSVETFVPGTYELVYCLEGEEADLSKTRVIRVEDTTPPVITLNFREGYGVSPLFPEEYEEEGFSAADIVDGDLTAAVTAEQIGTTVRYTVSDSSGNVAEITREIPLADWRPEIVLTGGTALSVKTYADFKEPGFTALDAWGHDLSSYVEVKAEAFDANKTGTFHITYTMSYGGDSVSVTRTVTVTGPIQKIGKGKVIYLTFDDGPSYLTATLLDTLKKYNVKATFFVTGQKAPYFDYIGRAYREGHAIGVHTYTHKLSSTGVYKSAEAFWADIDRIQEVVKAQTGSYTNLMRFAGGSSCISSYNEGLETVLTQQATERGYKYFDWNVTAGDGAVHTSEYVRDRVIKYVQKYNTSIVLMHDNRDFTVAAVEEIIQWCLENGFTFATLNYNSYAAQHIPQPGL